MAAKDVRFDTDARDRMLRGVNILALWAASHACGYRSGVWGTYRQWAEAGAQVRKGEKSSYVVFYKELEFAQNDGTDPETRLFARATPVFAADRSTACTLEPVSNRSEIERIAAVEAFVAPSSA